jgi:hypothetical protein
MIVTKELEKIKEYDRFILFRDKKTGIRECILKTDLVKIKNEKRAKENKWEMEEYKNTNYKNNFAQRRMDV